MSVEKVLLFISMLGVVGVDVVFVWIGYCVDGCVDLCFMILYVFDNVVVWVDIDGEVVWLDLMDFYLLFGLFDEENLGMLGFVMVDKVKDVVFVELLVQQGLLVWENVIFDFQLGRDGIFEGMVEI